MRELTAAKQVYGMTSMRVFLHNYVFEADGEQLLVNIDDFLGIAEDLGMRVGFVFFDDCWSTSGASTEAECQNRPGVHNGCWMTCPQASDRGNGTEPFRACVNRVALPSL